MRQVTTSLVEVSKADLLSRLRKNLAVHQDQLGKAIEGWRAEQADRLTQCRDKLLAAKTAKQIRDARMFTIEQAPQDHSREYFEAISMFEWHKGDLIELDHATFRRLVLDKWDWSEEFLATSSRYVR